MRYGACTDDDVSFLRSRIAGTKSDQPNLNTEEFRNVSIITAWNIHKDAINDLGAAKFARDTNQELVSFYSIDKLSTKGVDRNKWKGSEQARSMTKKLQTALWEAPASATNEHIPGKVQLCISRTLIFYITR